jgi:deoxyribodipyrimidine photo-lyase
MADCDETGGPFKVYSPFWRACQRTKVEAARPAHTIKAKLSEGIGERRQDWPLLPTKPNWAIGFQAEWTSGEAGAQQRLKLFLDENLAGYGVLRNRPNKPNVSRLSPHLHWGEISPRQIWLQRRCVLAMIPLWPAMQINICLKSAGARSPITCSIIS